ADLVERFLLQLYGTEDGESWNDTVPREVLAPALPEDAPTVSAGLRECRGSNVNLRVPQRGDKRNLMETVARNAAQSLALHKTKRGSDLTTRSIALAEIQEGIGLVEALLRVECYDVSQIQETDVVASMVVFEGGLARKSEYRRFVIRGLAAVVDTASIHEVITRRFRRYLDEKAKTGELEGEGNEAADVPVGIDPE